MRSWRARRCRSLCKRARRPPPCNRLACAASLTYPTLPSPAEPKSEKKPTPKDGSGKKAAVKRVRAAACRRAAGWWVRVGWRHLATVRAPVRAANLGPPRCCRCAAQEPESHEKAAAKKVAPKKPAAKEEKPAAKAKPAAKERNSAGSSAAEAKVRVGRRCSVRAQRSISPLPWPETPPEPGGCRRRRPVVCASPSPAPHPAAPAQPKKKFDLPGQTRDTPAEVCLAGLCHAAVAAAAAE